jgi:hypothetical protein
MVRVEMFEAAADEGLHASGVAHQGAHLQERQSAGKIAGTFAKKCWELAGLLQGAEHGWTLADVVDGITGDTVSMQSYAKLMGLNVAVAELS